MKKGITVGVVAGLSILIIAYSISRIVPVGVSPAASKGAIKAAPVKAP
jgi:hypothetical protein